MNKIGVLVFSSSFPRWAGDYNGNFIHELSIRLKKSFNIFVLAPASQTTKSVDTVDDIKVFRHKQSPIKWGNLANGNPIMAKLRKNNLYWVVVPYFLFQQLLGVRSIISKENISIIHAHWLIPQALIAVIYKKLFNKKIKILATIHGSDINGFKSTFVKSLIKFILRNINELSVVSKTIEADVKKLGYEKNISVFPMGIDTNLFNSLNNNGLLKSSLGINGKFILFVGSLVEGKGIRFLVQAMPEIVKVFPKSKLVIIGDGQLKPVLLKMCNKLNIANNVLFIGAVENKEMPSYYSSADLFVLPSFSEGYSLVVREALSCKTSVVVSHLNAYKDLIIENETGFYLKEISAKEISRKIIEVLNNTNRDTIAEKGREKVIDNSDWSIIEKKYTELLLGL